MCHPEKYKEGAFLKGGTTVNLTVLFKDGFLFLYMNERDLNRSLPETLAIGLLGELKASGSCNLEMLREVIGALTEGNSLRIALLSSLDKCKLTPLKECVLKLKQC